MVCQSVTSNCENNYLFMKSFRNASCTFGKRNGRLLALYSGNGLAEATVSFLIVFVKKKRHITTKEAKEKIMGFKPKISKMSTLDTFSQFFCHDLFTSFCI